MATSDGLEQIIIRGQGCHLLSARELLDEVNATSRRMQEEYTATQVKERNFLGDLDSFKEIKTEEDV